MPDPLTASKIAAELSLSGANVKKAIAELGLKAVGRKGARGDFDRAQIAKIMKALKEAPRRPGRGAPG